MRGLRKAILIVFLLQGALSLSARDTLSIQIWDSLRHELRIGWGESLFEHALRYEFPHIGRPNVQDSYLTGHFFVEYQYAWTWLVSTGMQIDYLQMGWKDRREIVKERHYYYDLTFLPAVRFTFYRRPYVNLYAGLGAGLTINGGTEKDIMKDTYTICYPNLDLTLLGLQVGKAHWFGAVELGLMVSMLDTEYIIMAGSRLWNISVGYRL